jgi:hypothetical protein
MHLASIPRGRITGAKSTQEALADAFKALVKRLSAWQLEIIAKQMTLIILQTIFNALSGGNALRHRKQKPQRHWCA